MLKTALKNLNKMNKKQGKLEKVFIDRVETETLETLKRAHQTISTSVADEALAAVMKVEKGSPLLVVKRVYFSKSGRALGLCVTKFPGEAYKIEAELIKINP